MCKFKAQKAITLVTGTLIILCKVTSFSLMKETSYQILTSTLLFLTKLVNKKKKIQVLCTKKHMHGVGRLRHNFSLIGLISFHIVKAVNSLHFSCLSFFICMLGQESYLSKTTLQKYSPLAVYSMCGAKENGFGSFCTEIIF